MSVFPNSYPLEKLVPHGITLANTQRGRGVLLVVFLGLMERAPTVGDTTECARTQKLNRPISHLRLPQNPNRGRRHLVGSVDYEEQTDRRAPYRAGNPTLVVIYVIIGHCSTLAEAVTYALQTPRARINS
jgi:hypothetical protein